ncbi:hypothetical protein G7K_2792-t1 [Saitoella complicata NRRL Y-17804]|uniref:Uncharacterized protein n=1 Tax=Saitoella complicata (strain BCRC 22490 / CBS 7301 / JCM 7358 / NBRC 10748 / NRRL Y-17804) TaxID=698492 RepID=A0A0E9NFI2_SAICN|nr:hypothetical protein G7K_2792-t1 [Saitoella complicata NRRL Y-17804]
MALAFVRPACSHGDNPACISYTHSELKMENNQNNDNDFMNEDRMLQAMGLPTNFGGMTRSKQSYREDAQTDVVQGEGSTEEGRQEGMGDEERDSKRARTHDEEDPSSENRWNGRDRGRGRGRVRGRGRGQGRGRGRERGKDSFRHARRGDTEGHGEDNGEEGAGEHIQGEPTRPTEYDRHVVEGFINDSFFEDPWKAGLHIVYNTKFLLPNDADSIPERTYSMKLQ